MLYASYAIIFPWPLYPIQPQVNHQREMSHDLPPVVTSVLDPCPLMLSPIRCPAKGTDSRLFQGKDLVDPCIDTMYLASPISGTVSVDPWLQLLTNPLVSAGIAPIGIGTFTRGAFQTNINESWHYCLLVGLMVDSLVLKFYLFGPFLFRILHCQALFGVGLLSATNHQLFCSWHRLFLAIIGVMGRNWSYVRIGYYPPTTTTSSYSSWSFLVTVTGHCWSLLVIHQSS